ncbi:MAG: CapA family protein [Haloferacaceae archaeon]
MAAAPFRLAATGDAILTHGVSRSEGDRPRFDALADVLREADAALAQLEPALVGDDARHGSLRRVTDQYQYLAPFPGAIMGTDPRVLDDLTAMGVNLFSVASNHALDFGREGLRSTLDALRGRELTFAGVGRNLAEARSPAYLETAAGRVGLVDATTSVPPGGEAGVDTAAFDGGCGVNPLHVEWTYRVPPEALAQLRDVADRAGIERVKGEWLRRERSDWDRDGAFSFMHMRFAEATDGRPPGIYQSLHCGDRRAVLTRIDEAAARADWVVAALHAHQSRDGNRNTSDPPAFLESFARRCVEAGAHAVVVTGPHTLRGVEIHEGRPVFYSLGNFGFHEETIHRVPDAPDADATSTVPDVRGDDAAVGDGSADGGASGEASDEFDGGGPAAAGDVSDPSGEAEADASHDVDNWRSVVPACEFGADGTLDELVCYPCTLRPAADGPHRGTPVLATGEEARAILRTLARRSEQFGTTVRLADGVGVVDGV